MTPQPARIAHYTIVSKLGEGGMGAHLYVFRGGTSDIWLMEVGQ